MHVQNGSVLKSTSLLNDTIFQDTIILITEYNTNGALGFIINKKFHRAFNELEEFKQSIHFPIYEGGPVDQEHLFFVHMRPDVIEEGTSIGNGLYFGGNFKQAVECINSNRITQQHIKIFIGYCGWDKDELEAEITEGSWILHAPGSEIIF